MWLLYKFHMDFQVGSLELSYIVWLVPKYLRQTWGSPG